MGCDIHCYIEYQDTYNKRDDHWSPFGGRINPGRNYEMFERLAGVRGDVANALVAPRGIPAKMGYSAADDYWLWISDDATKSFVSDTVTRADAELWVKTGSSVYRDADKKYVSHPDWHTPSWLSFAEFDEVVNDIDPNGSEDQYWAMLGAMEQLPNARVVFWFDN